MFETLLLIQEESIVAPVNRKLSKPVSSELATIVPIYFHSMIKEPRWADNSYLSVDSGPI